MRMKTARIVVTITVIIFVTLINLGVTFVVWYNLNVVPLAYSSNENVVQPISSSIDQNTLWYEIQFWRKGYAGKEYLEHDVLCEYTDKRLKETLKDYNHPISSEWGVDNPSLRIFTTMGENINIYCGNNCLGSWLLSPPHAKVLTADFKYSCLRCNETNCVQLFAN